MKLKFISMIAIVATFMSACCNKPKTYNSVDEYPEYKGNDLGVTYTPNKSFFRVWSPAAQEVRLNIYADALEGAPTQVFDMKYDVDGTWTYTVKEDLIGKFYTFQIKQNDQWLEPTPGIWAKAVGVNGVRGAIIDWNTTNPEGWENDVRPEMKSFTDAIIYEVHMRDYTIHASSGSSFPGKFLGLSEAGTKTIDGLTSGIDHLKELGITHVQILPSYDYGSIDETRLADNKYNWGYDPKNYNVPEGGYATDPYSPATRILELKTMIQQLHAAGIRVIMDVVYNHTFVGDNSHLNLQAPGYFYRMNEDGSWGNGSGCGNETASERAMMRRFMVESIKYWVEEYHMDGFRFDLMGIHDIETMNQIRTAVDAIDPTISIHGEGWAAGGCGIPEELRAVKNNAHQFSPVGVFSDDIRDGLRGKWTDGNKGGFVSGRGLDESIKFGVVGATAHPQIDLAQVAHTNVAYATTPAQVINYMSCHDDPCVVDKLKAIHPEATIEEIIRMDLLGQTIVFTAQGVPFIYAGEELLRDKKGVHNTYQSPDSINQIDWTNKVKYAEVYDYYRNLIALRKAHPAFRMSDAAQVAEAIQFVETPANVVAYTLNGSLSNDSWNQIFVIYNGNTTDVELPLPEGTWTAACYNAKINENGLGNFTGKINVPYTSAVILYRK